eukprot:XP_001699539.1 predicted protein [Chlamydomonas reinhardtii]
MRRGSTSELTSALSGVDQRLAAAEGEREQLAAALAAAEARAAERSAAAEELLVSVRGVLSGTHHELVGMSSEQYKSLMDYLGRDKALAAAQLELLSSERNKLREEREAAVRQATVLRGQMAALQDSLATSRADLTARINALEAEDHARRLAQGQLRGELEAARAGAWAQLDELRGAKAAADADLEKTRKDYADVRARANALIRKNRELTAAADAAGKEAAAVKEELAGAKEALAAREVELSAAREEAAKAKAEAEAAHTETTNKLKAHFKQLQDRWKSALADKSKLDAELQARAWAWAWV